jgi:hypothetical protein
MKTKKFKKYLEKKYFKLGKDCYVDKELAGAMPEYAPPMGLKEIYNEYKFITV